MKCLKKKAHFIDLQIDETITIKDALQERQYEYADCIYQATIQWPDRYFINGRGPRNFK